MSIHYPKRTSRIKRRRTCGFLSRMRTKRGRNVVKRQRAKGRHNLNAATRR